ERRSAGATWSRCVVETQADIACPSCGHGNRPEVEAALRNAAALIEATEARAYTSWVHVERAELPRVVGDEVGRQRELREAHRLFTEMGATARAEQVARGLGSSTESTSGISSTSRT